MHEMFWSDGPKWAREEMDVDHYSTHCQCAICERSDIKWAKVEHRVDGDKMEKFSPVQNLSMSSSCCLVAKTHIGSGAASLR